MDAVSEGSSLLTAYQAIGSGGGFIQSVYPREGGKAQAVLSVKRADVKIQSSSVVAHLTLSLFPLFALSHPAHPRQLARLASSLFNSPGLLPPSPRLPVTLFGFEAEWQGQTYRSALRF